MTKPRGQVAHFRIYPEPGTSRLFFHVRVFRTVRDMHVYVRHRRVQPLQPGRFCKGACSYWRRYLVDEDGRKRLQPEIGEVVYAQQWIGARILSHELTHAMFAWASRRGVDVTDRGTGRTIGAGEERACGVLGDLMRQVSIYLWDHGLAK